MNELYRLAETVTGKDKLVIDAENNRTLEAVVVTDVDGGNVSANNLMVMTEGATQAKNGILLFSSGQYTNPKDPAFPFKSGDKVRFTLVKGLAKVANFSNCYEVTCESSDAATWLTAEVIGKAQLTPVPLTSIDNLIDYQGMLVTVKNVTSPATAGNWAVGTTTFKVGSSDLTVYVTQDAAGFAGKQYAASKTGDLTGYVSLYKGAVQLCPRNMTDAAAFAEGGTDPEPADPRTSCSISVSEHRSLRRHYPTRKLNPRQAAICSTETMPSTSPQATSSIGSRIRTKTVRVMARRASSSVKRVRTSNYPLSPTKR